MDDIGQNTGARSISEAQFRAIEKAAERDLVRFETVSFDADLVNGPPLFIWQEDHILVRSDVDEKSHPKLVELGAVLAPGLGPRKPQQRVREDLVKLLELKNLKRMASKPSTREIVKELNERDGLKGKVFVNNLVYVTHQDGAQMCPATEPIPRRRYPHTIPYPPPSPGNAGEGVRITVIDTGMSKDWKENHPWLFKPNTPTEVSGPKEFDTREDNGEIAPHAGHGMFIAGLIRCVAPRATVKVKNTMRWAGSMTEDKVAQAIMDVLDSDPPPDIISFSAGYMIHDEVPGGGPAAMLDVMRRLAQPGCKTVLVAATGNDGHGPEDHGLFYPAAFATDNEFVRDGLLVAVGALREDRLGRACFSNYGDWVTVYEEGVNLVNAFPSGPYTYREPLSATEVPKCTYYPDKPLEQGCCCLSAPTPGSVALFDGMAAWSGTSFATPIVAGRIARHITENSQFKEQPRNAVLDLLDRRITIVDAGDDSTKLPVFPYPAVTGAPSSS